MSMREGILIGAMILLYVPRMTLTRSVREASSPPSPAFPGGALGLCVIRRSKPETQQGRFGFGLRV